MSGDLPWGLVKPLGKPVPEEVDPRTLPGGVPFLAYSVEENDLHLTLFLRHHNAWEKRERRRLFIAEQPDAVYLLLVFGRAFDPAEHIGRGWAGGPPGVESAHAMLEQPLSQRRVVDAFRDEAVTRVRSEPSLAFFDRVDPDNAKPDLFDG